MKWVNNFRVESAVVGPLRKDFHTDQGFEKERARHEKRMKSRILGLPKAVQDSETIEGLREEGMVGVYELEKEDVVLNGPETELLIKGHYHQAFEALITRLGLQEREQMAWEVINEAGGRIGSRTRVPCVQCDGEGSIHRWKAIET